MDGLTSCKNGDIFIMVASNTPWDLDSSFLRRIEKRIFVPLPTLENRFKILDNGLKKFKRKNDVDL